MKVVEAETAKGNKNFTLFHKNVKIFRSYQQKKQFGESLPQHQQRRTNKQTKHQKAPLKALCHGCVKAGVCVGPDAQRKRGRITKSQTQNFNLIGNRRPSTKRQIQPIKQLRST